MKRRLIKILTVICIMLITLNVSAMGPDSTLNCSIVDKTSKDHLYYGNNKSFNTIDKENFRNKLSNDNSFNETNNLETNNINKNFSTKKQNYNKLKQVM